jgi:hypothetical protein
MIAITSSGMIADLFAEEFASALVRLRLPQASR